MEQTSLPQVKPNPMTVEILQSAVHDFRAPITVIKGYLHLLLNGMMGPMTAEQLDVLKRSAAPLEDLILMTDNLMQSLSLQNPQMEIHPAPFNLDLLLSEVLEFYHLSFTQRQMKLYRQGNTFGLTVEADLFWVKRLLNNLIWNAYKFTPDQGNVSLHVTRKLGGTEISIQDTGRGIPPESLQHIFDKFKQASSQDRHQGHGLGLWICKRVMELHGGHISVQSEVGIGSIFSIWFPDPITRTTTYKAGDFHAESND